MTYRVLPITYQAHLDMIPSLTDEQRSKSIPGRWKRAIMLWMPNYLTKNIGGLVSIKDVSTNYLAAQGYDLKKEREAWQARKKEKAA